MNAITSAPTNLMDANRQWSTRPADERFLSLIQLRDFKRAQRQASAAKVVSSRALTVQPASDNPNGGLEIVGQNGTPATMTHWSFGQLSQLAGAPAGYMRRLPAPLAADCLNYGLKIARDVEDVGVLLTRPSSETPGRTHLAPFCDDCMERGWEARDFKSWTRAELIETADGPRLQAVMPGAEPSAVQARQSRDAANGGRLRKGPNKPTDFGLFGAPPQRQLFDVTQPAGGRTNAR